MNDWEKAELAEQNMPLVWYVVKKYAGSPIDCDELYSAALLGMARALSAYDETKGTKFSTFAVMCMNCEILRLLRAFRKRKLDISYEGLIQSSSNGDERWHESFVSVTAAKSAAPGDIATKIVIHDFIKRLPERDREILRLRMNGMRQHEIGKRIGLSQPQIGRMLIRMKEKLWNELYLK